MSASSPTPALEPRPESMPVQAAREAVVDREPLSVPRDSLVSDHLDCVRGLAAVGVLLSHGRNLFFDDYQQLTSPGLMTKFAYLATGLGHEMVMVFFVLSGFFIGSSVLRDIRAARWSTRRYAASRFARLYVVLIPALLLTWILDQIGLRSTDSTIYFGVGPQTCIDDVRQTLGAGVLLGNLLFLESLYVPPFGTNGPLWSLSYEFWYYVLFPVMCLVAVRRGQGTVWKGRIGLLLLFAITAGLAWKTLPLFPVWLMGALIAAGRRLRLPDDAISRGLLPFSVIVFVAALMASRLRLLPGALLTDYTVGIGFSVFLLSLLHLKAASRRGAYSRFARGLAGMSFSLYLTHVPILVLVAATLNLESRWAPTGENVLKFSGVLLATLAIAWVFAQLTEKHTDQVRRWLLEGRKTADS